MLPKISSQIWDICCIHTIHSGNTRSVWKIYHCCFLFIIFFFREPKLYRVVMIRITCYSWTRCHCNLLKLYELEESYHHSMGTDTCFAGSCCKMASYSKVNQFCFGFCNWRWVLSPKLKKVGRVTACPGFQESLSIYEFLLYFFEVIPVLSLHLTVLLLSYEV